MRERRKVLIEQQLALAKTPPREAMAELIRFTWEYYCEHPEFIRLLNSERIGRSIAIDVLRRGTLRSFEVTPSERPAMKAA